MRKDKDWLKDIFGAASELAFIIEHCNSENFITNRMARPAAQYLLMIIGEAVTQLSDEFKQTHSEISWQKIAGYRHAAIHGYFKFDWAVVWKTAPP